MVDNKAVKINEPIIFPTQLELPSGSSYQIVATINHLGETVSSGHYTTLLFDPDTSRFTLVDDESITPSVDIDEELCREVYILVYTKV